MVNEPLRFVFLGLSITSSWANGHATTYRALLRALCDRGHQVLFLERDPPWYAGNRELPRASFCLTGMYRSIGDLKQKFTADVRDADVVIVGSHVPEGAAIGEWVVNTAQGFTAFYDTDTPFTLVALGGGNCDYLTPRLVTRYQLYLSCTGGPVLQYLERDLGAPAARPFYCSIDPELFGETTATEQQRDLGYMGTYREDRQPTLERLLLDSARRWPGGRFAAVGSRYPNSIIWPPNIERTVHLAPAEHGPFHRGQRFTLNITSAPVLTAGYSPSVHLFEAAASGTPIITDRWEGLETFFALDREILVARSSRDVLASLIDMPERQRRRIGERARERVLREHTAVQRARELESYVRHGNRIESVV